MTDKEISIEEGNKLIHIWLGKSYETDRKIMIIKYNSSWDWLMQVVEKIEAIGFEIDLCQNCCLILNDIKHIPEPITLEKLPANKRFEADIKAESKIIATWKAVVQFIQWYQTKNS